MKISDIKSVQNYLGEYYVLKKNRYIPKKFKLYYVKIIKDYLRLDHLYFILSEKINGKIYRKIYTPDGILLPTDFSVDLILIEKEIRREQKLNKLGI